MASFRFWVMSHWYSVIGRKLPSMRESSNSTSNRDQLDWRVASLVAAGACAAIGLLECAKDYVMLEIEGTEQPMISVLRNEALWWVLWMLCMPGIIALGRRFPFDGGRWRQATAIHLTLAIVLSLAQLAAFGSAYYWVAGPSTWGPTVGKTLYVFTNPTSRPMSSSTPLRSASISRSSTTSDSGGSRSMRRRPKAARRDFSSASS